MHRPRPLALGLVPDEQRITCNPCLHPRTSSSESAVAQRLQANELGECSPRPNLSQECSLYSMNPLVIGAAPGRGTTIEQSSQ